MWVKVERTCNCWTMTVAGKKAMIKWALRKISMYWKPIAEARKRAKVGREVYTFLVDVYKWKWKKKELLWQVWWLEKVGLYKCNSCWLNVPEKIAVYVWPEVENINDVVLSKDNIKMKNYIEVDHINSVVEEVGVTNWDSIINRMFEEDIDKYQLLCKECHNKKTKEHINNKNV